MSETTQRDHLHMFDDDLQALARRNYQGGMPIELLSDAYLFEEHGNYFHTVDVVSRRFGASKGPAAPF